MNKYLEEIFRSGQFTNSKGMTSKVTAETSKAQCEFLQSIIRQNGFSQSLEIGLAFGISALAITEEVVRNNGSHFVIDKFQFEDWNGNGLDLLTQAGYRDKIVFEDKFSYEVLPLLLSQKKKFDFAYIDSTKQFDWLLVDFFFIDKLLDINGIVVFDDVGYHSIRKLIRFISQFPAYKIEKVFPFNSKPGSFHQLYNSVSSLPGIRKLMKQSLVVKDYESGINAACVALRKTDEDRRDWKWDVPF